MLTSSSLSGKHDTVSSIQDGVSDIRALGTGRTWVGNHRLKHLGGSDNWLSGDVGLADHHLLGEENLLWWDLHTKVTTSNHDTISDLKDLIVVVKTFLVLNLADNLDVLVIRSKDLSDHGNIRSLTDEGRRNEVDLIRNSPLKNILDILRSESWEVDNDSREVHVLTLTDVGVILDTSRNFAGADVARKDSQDKGSIGNKDLLTRGDRRWKGCVRASNLLAVSLERVVCGEDKSLALDELDLVGSVEETRADLRSLGVEENSCNERGGGS